MTEHILKLVREEVHLRQIVCLNYDGYPVTIDTDHIHDLEFDDTNGVVHFRMNKEKTREYGL